MSRSHEIGIVSEKRSSLICHCPMLTSMSSMPMSTYTWWNNEKTLFHLITSHRRSSSLLQNFLRIFLALWPSCPYITTRVWDTVAPPANFDYRHWKKTCLYLFNFILLIYILYSTGYIIFSNSLKVILNLNWIYKHIPFVLG